MLQTSGDRLATTAADRAEPPSPATVARAAGPTVVGGGDCSAVPPEHPEAADGEQPKGCLYALSQPPLMLFLSVIGGLIGGGAAWDLLCL
ncbi:hypothetical protein [Streptomyces sp.]|uniref:hypothetical protein n=1 Tax=Streptomyces sp. TaxID=1931 RepID=UPI002F407224